MFLRKVAAPRAYQEWQAKFPELVDEIVAAAKPIKTE